MVQGALFVEGTPSQSWRELLPVPAGERNSERLKRAQKEGDMPIEARARSTWRC